jgi:hypothetical protein
MCLSAVLESTWFLGLLHSPCVHLQERLWSAGKCVNEIVRLRLVRSNAGYPRRRSEYSGDESCPPSRGGGCGEHGGSKVSVNEG